MATNSEKNSHINLEAIRSDIAALTQNVGNLMHQASDAQAAMAKTTGKAAKAATDIGGQMWSGGARLGHDAAEAAADTAHAGMSNLEKRLTQNPVSAVLIALAVGFLVAVLGLKRK